MFHLISCQLLRSYSFDGQMNERWRWINSGMTVKGENRSTDTTKLINFNSRSFRLTLFKKFKKIEIVTFLKARQISFFEEIKAQWEVGRTLLGDNTGGVAVNCGRSSSSVKGAVFELATHTRTHTQHSWPHALPICATFYSRRTFQNVTTAQIGSVCAREEKNISWFWFIYQNSHTKCLGIEPGPQQWEAEKWGECKFMCASICHGL